MSKIRKFSLVLRFVRGDFIKILLFTLSVFPSVAFADWEATLKAKFNIVETFDNLQDWRGLNYNGTTGLHYGTGSDMPKKSDGSASMWTHYAQWAAPPNTKWISDYGAGTKITGKSAKIDLSSVEGPSHLGTYFGNGSASSGYDDIYIFYRVKFPVNEWPTSIAGGEGNNNVGTYTEGQTWAYFSSWKFNTINMGCTASNGCNGPEPYSNYHIIPHIKISSGRLLLNNEPKDSGNGAAAVIWANDGLYSPPRNEWIGVEFHYKNSASKVTTMDVWVYDAAGVAHQVQSNAQFTYGSHPATDKWNFFWFGGNNSSAYSWGPTMKGAYYVDDFIINGTRIGPDYYGLLSGTAPAINAPKNVSGTAVK